MRKSLISQFILLEELSLVHLVLDRHTLASLLVDEKVFSFPRLLAVLEHEYRPVVLDHVALSLDVAVPQARLPELGYLFGFVPRWISADGHKGHHGSSLLSLLQKCFWIAHIDLGHIDLWRWSEMFWQLIRLQRLIVLLQSVLLEIETSSYWPLSHLPLVQQPFQVGIVIVTNIFLRPFRFVVFRCFLTAGKVYEYQEAHRKEDEMRFHFNFVRNQQNLMN